ncbi:hypothetical protein [Nonomuraea sp. NEAU-A123]|uniref:SCO3933 family regulatory protein n=1 Tax=Nonomuraea sp. NEAU-A123 TaxID=2839649 RepID=UPI001BE3E7CC|nr:hypothetical protein [Nonomuraea sp. NEAU-A123]MBT2226428.1 hypothetical protein [Nonomuraea sp. NEAU-A123]
MRNLSVDTTALAFTVAGEPEPKIVGRTTGEVKRDAEGRELYTIPLLPKLNDDRRNPAIVVTLPSETFPQIPEGVQVAPVGLTAFYWQMNGRSRLGFSAETIRPAAKAA